MSSRRLAHQQNRGRSPAGVASAWTPQFILPQLAAWWDTSDTANRIITSSKYQQLTDKSGNGKDATQGTAADRPTMALINGLDVMAFVPGTNTKLAVGNFSSLTAASIYAVHRAAADPPLAGGGGFHLMSNSGLSNHVPFTDNNVYDGWGSTTRRGPTSHGVSLAVAHVYVVVSTSTEWTNWQDSTQLSTTGTNTVSFLASGLIGSDTVTQPGDGELGEVVICNGKLSSGDDVLIRRYLSKKWGTP